jgi:hypothetical protein
MNSRKVVAWLAVAVAVLGLVLAQTVQRQLNLLLNGRPSSAKAIVVGGQSYVPVSALRELGITVSLSGNTLSLSSQAAGQAAGGAGQRASLEGCLNEWLFNGIWRVRVTKVERAELEGVGLPSWNVTLEVRNGTNKTLQPWRAGWKGTDSITLVFADGSIETMDTGPEGGNYNDKIHYAAIPQGATAISTLHFISDRTDPPTKLLIEMDPEAPRKDKEYNLAFSVPNPSLRIKLDCAK